MSRVPKPGESLRVSPELATCPRVPKPQTTSGSPPSKPHVPRTLSPGVSPGDHPSTPRVPRPHPGEPRMHPNAPRVPSRETTRVPLRSAAKASTGDPRALGEYAMCPRECFLFRRILENTQKIVRTLEMHNKSNFDPKDVIPIFMAFVLLSTT